MKPVVLFYSFSGSTRRVAEILAKRLGAPAVEVRTKEPIRHPYGVGFLNRIKERTPEIAVDADLVSFARAEAVEGEVALAGVARENLGKAGGDFERRPHRRGV